MSATGVWRQLGQYLGFLPKDVIGESVIVKRLYDGVGAVFSLTFRRLQFIRNFLQVGQGMSYLKQMGNRGGDFEASLR